MLSTPPCYCHTCNNRPQDQPSFIYLLKTNDCQLLVSEQQTRPEPCPHEAHSRRGILVTKPEEDVPGLDSAQQSDYEEVLSTMSALCSDPIQGSLSH